MKREKNRYNKATNIKPKEQQIKTKTFDYKTTKIKKAIRSEIAKHLQNASCRYKFSFFFFFHFFLSYFSQSLESFSEAQ